jgi:predicted nucleic acid-binding protein
MILIDTSVWIEFFKQDNRFVEELTPLLMNKMVVTLEPVFSELLYGVRNSRDKKKILSYWEILPKIEFGANAMLKAAEFANDNNYHNIGIGLMDAVIIKSAIEGNHSIWTLDNRINKNIENKFLYQ